MLFCRSWLVDSRAIAKKVKNASWSSSVQITDCGANRECPNCHYRIDNSDVFPQWPGLPVGVKFDPSDAELLDHLAAKCGVGDSKEHLFIDEFILTLGECQGICYTHPENLPGKCGDVLLGYITLPRYYSWLILGNLQFMVMGNLYCCLIWIVPDYIITSSRFCVGARKDGSSIHFFHRTINAYSTGPRKRRKIQNQDNTNEEHVRWHKTGKTKPVTENGVHKGWKKIMVLYKSTKKGCKPEKSNWVMHQYHLGDTEDEHDGEYVVSKIFYQQQKQTEKNDDSPMTEEPDNLMIRTSPRTPKTITPDPPRPWKSMILDDIEENMHQEAKFAVERSDVHTDAVQCEDNSHYPAWLAGESQAVENPDFNGFDEFLLCNELLDSSSLPTTNDPKADCAAIETKGNNDASCGISELENLEFDTPPDVTLADLQFGSQESILSWLDRL
ncbi:hypothetical protein Goarm_014025 [Gossypium armourianum]|uniref:NAC domain-containing protein n=1 Tax=Gossypium armourianum TaxID=34283 RepID=A0A7J9J523_9ROSI|nr:hypothetical protein [Gossypium armourianum]